MINPKDFNIALQRNVKTQGSLWAKADFHVHYPSSSDYEYGEHDAVEKLGVELQNQGYKFAIVLKHQEFPTREELDNLHKYCPQTMLIPGSEINVFVEAMFKKVGHDHFFHCTLAVDPDTNSDFGYLLQRAKEQFNYKDGPYPAGFYSNIRDIGRFFVEKGALFLPAHLHQSEKPENSRSIDDIYDDESFLGILEDGAFTCLEVRQSSTAKFFEGGHCTKDGISIPEVVCVRSSDAHHHNHIVERNRKTWVLIEDNSFQELRAALSYRHRVFISEPPIAEQRIIGLHVSGSFLSEVWISFNPRMNSLIGCKGSGKTSILECLRFLFGTNIPKERRDNVQKHISHILGPSGIVECLVAQGKGEELVLSRRADSPQRLILTRENGLTLEVESLDEHFEVTILGWHEIEAVSESAQARIGLLDRIGEDSRVAEIYHSIDKYIESARDQLPILQLQLKKLKEAFKELWDLQTKRNTLVKLEKEDLVNLQNRYEWFLNTEEKLLSYINRLEQHKNQLEKDLPFTLDNPVGEDLNGTPPTHLQGKIDEINKAFTKLEESDKRNLTELQSSRDDAVKLFESISDEMRKSFTSFRDAEYNPRVQALPKEERDILTRQIHILEETRQLPQKEEECKAIHSEVVVLAGQIEKFCEKVCKARDEICDLRNGIVSRLNDDLKNVQLEFKRSGNKTRLSQYQSKYAADSNDYLTFLQEFGRQENYENLRDLFSKLRQMDISADKWNVNELILDIKFVGFLDVVDDDDVEISLSVGEAGFVSIQNLSAGQRCTAVFPILLRNARGPLVIDQPEDNLDNRHIADTISPDLMRKKNTQQFIITSHNANLVVLADADLIVHMDSDGTNGKIVKKGFLSCPNSSIKSSVLDVLDGGEIALEARRQKYGHKELASNK